MKKSFLSLLLLAALAAGAQPGTNCRFRSIVGGGVIAGSSGIKPLVQTIQGVQHGRYFAGIGLGLDPYYYRSVPLFLSLRTDLLKKHSSPFVYADFGANLPWVRSQADDRWEMYDARYRAGIYLDAGAGYKVGVAKKAILFTLGISEKRTHEIETLKPEFDETINPLWRPTRRYDTYFTFRRVVLKASFAF